MNDVHSGMMQNMQEESLDNTSLQHVFCLYLNVIKKIKIVVLLKDNLWGNEDNKLLSIYVHTDVSIHYVVRSVLKTIIKMRRS